MTDATPTPDWLVSWAGDGDAAVLEVTASGSAAAAVSGHVPALVVDEVASRIAAGDPDLWTPQAAVGCSEAADWVDLHETARDLAAPVRALHEELSTTGPAPVVLRTSLRSNGIDALAAQVICAASDLSLTVLDLTDPVAPSDGVVVVNAGAGDAAETLAALAAAGVDVRTRVVVVTDPVPAVSSAPASPVAASAASSAAELGCRAVFRTGGEPDGFGALGARALVPAGLAGVDLDDLLDEATAVADLLCEDAEGNPALVLGAALAGLPPTPAAVTVLDSGSGLALLPQWVRRLLSEVADLPPGPVDAAGGPTASTGLCVRLVSGADETAEIPADDNDAVDDADLALSTGDTEPAEATVAGPLGAQFLLWQYATAVVGRIRGFDPYRPRPVQDSTQGRAALGVVDEG